jgi:membrane protein
MLGLTGTWHILRDAALEFNDDDAMTLGAALAFYTALSMAPLLVILVWLAGTLNPGSERDLVAQIQSVIGGEGARAVRMVVNSARRNPDLGTFAGIISLVTLLFSASAVFAQLQYALNRFWDVTAQPRGGMVWPWVRKRLLSMGMVFSIGFLLVVSLVASAMITTLAEHVRSLSPQAEMLWQVASFAIALAVYTGFFALLYAVLPDVRLAFRDVWAGALVTAVLFDVGRYAIAVYLGSSSMASAYGAAGSFVALLLWVYYASLIVFFGAEVTHVLVLRRGEQVHAEEHAEPAEDADPKELRTGSAH